MVRQWLAVLTLLTGGMCCGSLAAAEPAAKHIVLISVDGLPAYLFDDPNASMPTIRKLAADGAVAKGMKVSNPSVTWPNHTSLVTGVRPEKHGVLFNGVLEKAGPGLPVSLNSRTDKSALVHVPTLYDVLHAQGKATVGINWPCTRNSGTLAVDFPDSPDTLKYSTTSFLDEMQAAGLFTADQRASFNKITGPMRDEIWTNAACHAIRTQKPPFLLLHLLNLDSTHHKYGPQTTAGYSAVAAADRWIQEVLNALEDAGIRDQTTVFVVADHGFNSLPPPLLPNVALRKAGLLTVEGSNVTTARAQVYPEGGIGMLYLTQPQTKADDQKKIMELFKDQEGIAGILTPDQFAEYGLPHPDVYEQMADLILVAKDGYGFAGTATGEEVLITSTTTLGTHGFLSTNPRMNATFVMAGAGVRPGTKLDMIENIDVAPTAARLLGVTFPNTDGRVLAEALE